MNSKLTKLALTATLGLAITLTLNACEEKEAANIKDSRDGKTYKTVKIGTQTWMAENLNYEAEGSKCYDNNPDNCQKYGRLYNWETAMKACPKGWHLPSKAEWEVLMALLDGKEAAGKSLKATSDWLDDRNGTDNYGFSALPGGNGGSDGTFYSVGRYGYWWSSSEGSASEYSFNNAYIRYMGYGSYVFYSRDDKSDLNSVRCLQDASKSPKAETQTATESESDGSGEDSCPNREGPPITIEAAFLEYPDDHEGRAMTIVRLANGNEMWLNGGPDDLKKGDKASITYYEDQSPFDTDCWQLNRVISWKEIGGAAATFTDARDLKTYKTVKIGKQTWMAENLNIKMGTFWCYNNEESNCKEYGKLYDHETAMKACPKGWHLPSREEWEAFAGSASLKKEPDASCYAGIAWTGARKLKARIGWYNIDGGISNDYGFSAVPGGWVSENGGEYSMMDIGESGKWWASDVDEEGGVSSLEIKEDEIRLCKDMGSSGYKNGYSVRCIKGAK
jgi:Fibrobacter succinogenes major domain (Fib_succ_major).